MIKLKTFLAGFTLAAAGLGFLSQQAQAATVTYTNGDLFIGFRSDANTNNYLINIGQASQFKNATQPITLNIGTTAADLVAFFGESWSTSEDLTWSVSGGLRSAASGDVAHTLYASKAIGGQPWNRQPASLQALASAKFNDLQKYYVEDDIGNPRQSTANSTVGILQQDGDVNSYSSFFTNSSAFGHFPGTTEASFATGVSGASLNFYRLVPGTGAGELLGTFTISEAGTITFTPVPEPGVLALGALAGAGFLMMRRYRGKSARA